MNARLRLSWRAGLRGWLLLALAISSLAGAPAAAQAAPAESCSWQGTVSGDWQNGKNWSCNRAPTSEDDVVIGKGGIYPYLNASATIGNLTLQEGRLALGGAASLNVTGNAEVGSEFTLANDGHYEALDTSVGIGGHLTAGGFGTFEGPFTVQWAGTLSPGSGTTLNLQDALTNYGTITPPSGGGGSINYTGPSLINDGQVIDALIVVAGTEPQTLAGGGSWSGTTLSIRGAVLQLDSDISYDGALLNVTNGSVLDVRNHTLALSKATDVNIPLGNVIAGTGRIDASDGVQIGNDGVVSPTLLVSGGYVQASGFGPFAGPLEVAAGATLSVTQSGTLLATNDVTITGRLEGISSQFLFKGPRFTDAGIVAVPTFHFQGSAQTLLGAGRFLTNTLLAVDPGAVVTMSSDHRLGRLSIAAGGTLDIAGRTLWLTGPGTPLTAIGTLATPNSTVVYAGAVTQTVTAWPVSYHDLTLDNPAGTKVETNVYDLLVGGLLRTQAGTFVSPDCTCNAVQIDAGVDLQTSAQVTGVLTLNNDLTVAGEQRLTLPNTATTAGSADVVGQVLRAGPFTPGTAYSFGNPLNTLAFQAGSTPPAEFGVILTKTLPGGLLRALARDYSLQFTGGSAYSATLRLHYSDAELGGIGKSQLRLWYWRANPWRPQAVTGASTTANWLEHSGLIAAGDWGLAAPYTAGLPALLRQ